MGLFPQAQLSLSPLLLTTLLIHLSSPQISTLSNSFLSFYAKLLLLLLVPLLRPLCPLFCFFFFFFLLLAVSHLHRSRLSSAVMLLVFEDLSLIQQRVRPVTSD